MFLRVRASFLIENLRLVRTSTRNTTLDDVVQANLARNFAHTLSVSSSSTCGSEQGVHLLQRQAFGLGEKEVDERSATEGYETEEDVLQNVSV
jgi:hypothetical protein